VAVLVKVASDEQSSGLWGRVAGGLARKSTPTIAEIRAEDPVAGLHVDTVAAVPLTRKIDGAITIEIGSHHVHEAHGAGQRQGRIGEGSVAVVAEEPERVLTVPPTADDQIEVPIAIQIHRQEAQPLDGGRVSDGVGESLEGAVTPLDPGIASRMACIHSPAR